MKGDTCRLCLAIGVKTSPLGSVELKNFIEVIFKSNGFDRTVDVRHVACYQCMALLRKCYNFMQRVIRAQKTLYNILAGGNTVTPSAIKNINRTSLKLNYDLTVKTIDNDLEIEFNEENCKNIDNPITSNSALNVNLLQEDKPNTNNTEHLIEVLKNDDKTNNFHQYPLLCTSPTQVIELDDSDENNVLSDVDDVKKIIAHNVPKNNKTSQENNECFNEYIDVKNPPSSFITIDLDKDTFKDNIKTKERENGNENIVGNECFVQNDSKLEHKDEDPLLIQVSVPALDYIPLNSKSGPKLITKGTVKLKKEKQDSNELNIEIPLSSKRNIKKVDYSKIGGCDDEGDSDFELSGQSTDESNDSESESYEYDDYGRRIKKRRQYPRECDLCDYEIPSGQAHHAHYKINHPNTEYPYASKSQYVCHHCGVIKTNIYHFRNHLLTHGSRKIHCPQCPRKFHNKVQLIRHFKYHGERSKFCDFCGKGFVNRVDLVLHLRIHTGEKPFKCHICSARFAHSGNLKIHIQTNHERDIVKKRKTKSGTKHKRCESESYTDSECDTKVKRKRKKKNTLKRRTKSDLATKQNCFKDPSDDDVNSDDCLEKYAKQKERNKCESDITTDSQIPHTSGGLSPSEARGEPPPPPHP